MQSIKGVTEASTDVIFNVARKVAQEAHVQAVCARSGEILTLAARGVRARYYESSMAEGKLLTVT